MEETSLALNDLHRVRPQDEIKIRRYNENTGDFTSAENSSADNSSDEFEHETVLR